MQGDISRRGSTGIDKTREGRDRERTHSIDESDRGRNRPGGLRFVRDEGRGNSNRGNSYVLADEENLVPEKKGKTMKELKDYVPVYIITP